jgi:hypothetical protein
VRRSIDQAFIDLRQHLLEWKQSGGKPGVRIFVYPPEWEALMLARFPAFVDQLAANYPLRLVDLGRGFLEEVERRKGFVDRLAQLGAQNQQRVLHDLGEIAQRYLAKLLATPLDPPYAGRLLINTGALGTFVSYSSIANALDDVSSSEVVAPTVLAFPGEGDERSLNLMGLRADTNYRVPRI